MTNHVTFFSFFICAFLSLSTYKAQPIQRFHICKNTTGTTFTPNSTYQSNLKHLLASLISNATSNTGFYNTTVGGSQDPETAVYGSFLCRGDLTPFDCRNCIATATEEVTQKYCPVENFVVIWYDQCMLRYSDVSFFGHMDVETNAVLGNGVNVTESPERFTELLENTMKELVAAASNGSSGPKKFATREASMMNITIYSMVQCTPDLSSSDCDTCLKTAVSVLPICCTGQQGATILYPSCNIRYERFRFYGIITDSGTPNQTSTLLPSPPMPQASPTGSGGNGKNSAMIIITTCASIAVVLLLILIVCYWRSRRGANDNDIQYDQNVGNDIPTVESLQFDFGTIRVATNNFSDDNKLGEGGFGAVYKGILSNGQEIAVKRLSRNSLQGAAEFKNEVLLVAKLQHRNLTRLLGFCLEGQEKILVYEFVRNRSLDNFLFDHSENQVLLDWSARYKVIGGIARGMLYLHEDSRLRIIHRDLKSSNILLDQNMNPKISDFGIAKICGVDQTRGNTNRIVGTYGYMAPEYAYNGQFSMKSDVYSFGVLTMEIITGKKNTRLLDSESNELLLSYAWKHWRDGTPHELLDRRLRDSYTENEVIRCIHIALLSVQEDPADRPKMASIVVMLNSYSVTLPSPKQPAFFPHSRTGGNMPLVGSDECESNRACTVNEMSSTQIYPR